VSIWLEAERGTHAIDLFEGGRDLAADVAAHLQEPEEDVNWLLTGQRTEEDGEAENSTGKCRIGGSLTSCM